MLAIAGISESISNSSMPHCQSSILSILYQTHQSPGSESGLTYSGSNPSFIAFCLFCCRCRSVSSRSCTPQVTLGWSGCSDTQYSRRSPASSASPGGRTSRSPAARWSATARWQCSGGHLCTDLTARCKVGV